ncbi:uncharacterized protein LOC143184787 [Calliopsis andreniformis]|uniref:uncharacterized protein LOC143184787 n=1 Tax=Calliopsis andreniformis TaxID=337506 RepID=UPI003FCD6672
MLRRSMKHKRAKRSRKSLLSQIQNFEVKDILVDKLKEQTPNNMLQLNSLNVSSPRTSNSSGVDVVSLTGELLRSDAVDKPASRETAESSYFPIRIVSNIIPQFDRNSSSLFKFIKICQKINLQVQSSYRVILLTIIRNKIIGQADMLISNREEPETVDGLINLLKEVYDSAFDINQIHGELRGLRQGIQETLAFYVARVREILNRGIQAAKDKFNLEQWKGVIALLNQEAVTNFKQGSRDQSLRLHFLKERAEDFEEIAKIVCELG